MELNLWRSLRLTPVQHPYVFLFSCSQMHLRTDDAKKDRIFWNHRDFSMVSLGQFLTVQEYERANP